MLTNSAQKKIQKNDGMQSDMADYIRCATHDAKLHNNHTTVASYGKQ